MGDDEQYPANDDPRLHWWRDIETEVHWSARRELDLPLLLATGEIFVRDLTQEEYDEGQRVGSIKIAKPVLWAGEDADFVMDAFSHDLHMLSGSVLQGVDYAEDFYEWFVDVFGILASGDPIFIDDIELPENSNPLKRSTCHVCSHRSGFNIRFRVFTHHRV